MDLSDLQDNERTDELGIAQLMGLYSNAMNKPV